MPIETIKMPIGTIKCQLEQLKMPIGTIEISIETHNWDVQTHRNKLENNISIFVRLKAKLF
jgi:hypothetical protein